MGSDNPIRKASRLVIMSQSLHVGVPADSSWDSAAATDSVKAHLLGWVHRIQGSYALQNEKFRGPKQRPGTRHPVVVSSSR